MDKCSLIVWFSLAIQEHRPLYGSVPDPFPHSKKGKPETGGGGGGVGAHIQMDGRDREGAGWRGELYSGIHRHRHITKPPSQGQRGGGGGGV